MKRKILISTLTFLFLVSTTGLSVTISFCRMADAQVKDACMMHHKPVSSGCCADETSENLRIVSFENSGCCETDFVFNKVKDDFLSVKTETTNVLVFSTLFVETVNQQSILFELNSNSFYTDTSPPLNSNPIYLNISQLLI